MVSHYAEDEIRYLNSSDSAASPHDVHGWNSNSQSLLPAQAA